MPLFLLNQFGKQELVDLPNDRHIQGELLWSEEKHGPLPDGVIVGAMDVHINYADEIDEQGRTSQKEFDRFLVLNAEKKAVLDNEMALKEAEKVQKENKKKAKDNLVFKLKNEDLKIHEINELLRELF